MDELGLLMGKRPALIDSVTDLNPDAKRQHRGSGDDEYDYTYPSTFEYDYSYETVKTTPDAVIPNELAMAARKQPNNPKGPMAMLRRGPRYKNSKRTNWSIWQK